MPEHEPHDDEPSPAGRLFAIIVSAGLAWAISVALVAWLLSFVLSR